MSDPVYRPENWSASPLENKTAQLVGGRCARCGKVSFPRADVCPGCASRGPMSQVLLSRRGKLWSFTNNCYKPPAPYVSKDPFETFAIANELEREKMVVLGQVVPEVGVGDLKAGMEMELVLDTLFEDDENEYMVWKWRPAA